MALRRPPRLREDLTPEQREARIAELRAKRKARRRKLAIRSALGTGFLLALAVAFVWWMVSTGGGRDFLLAQLKSRLPAGTELTWTSAEGPVRGPIVLEGVRFVTRGCPAVNEEPVAYPNCDTPRVTTFTARRVVVDPAIRPLFGKRLRLDALDVRDATLDLPDADEPFELPTWPDVLPQVAPPIALQADDIRIDRLKVTRVGEHVIDLRSVRGGLDAREGFVHVENLAIDSDLGRFAAHGDYAPGDNYRTDLAATAIFPMPAGAGPLQRTPPRIGLIAKGDLDDLSVGIGGAVPEPLRATLRLRGAERPTWSLRADAKGLDPAVLSGGEPSPAPMVIALQADGIGGQARVQGNFRQGDVRARILPSRLKLEDKVLAFQPLALDVFEGRVVVNGSGDFGDRGGTAPLRYGVVARGLRFGGSVDPDAPDAQPSPTLRVDADLGVAGRRDAWATTGKATVQRDGESAELTLDGRGNGDRLLLRSLQARMPTGTLDAKGVVGWAPATNWKLDATLDGFDPGYFAPDWNGEVNALIATQGRARDGGDGFDGTATISEIGGRLRGRALSGNADVKVAGQTYSGDLLLGVGKGRLQANGSYTAGPSAGWQAKATLDDFDPSLVLEEWNGAVDAELASHGETLPNGALQIDVDAQRLGGSLRGRALSGGGDVRMVLPQAGGMDAARFSGDIDLRSGGSHLVAEGSVADRFDVDAQFLPVRLDDFLPDAGGALQGSVRLTGPRRSPDIAADLNGSGLHYGEYRADSFTARGNLPWRGGGGNLAIRAQGLAVGTAFERLSVDASGAVENLDLRAEADSEALGSVALAGTAQSRNGNWSGTLADLRLQPVRGASWSLQSPARYAQSGANWTLSQSCFASSAGGSLCAQANWPGTGVVLSGQGLPLSLVSAYLPERDDGRDWVLNGDIALDARIRPSGTAWTGNARIASSQGGLRTSRRARNDLVGYRALQLTADFNPQRIQATLATGLSDGGRIDANVTTGWDDAAPLNGQVSINTTELTWLELFSPDIVDPQGTLAGNIGLGGTRGSPALGGQARLSGFSTELPALNIELTNGDVRMTAQADGSARIAGAVRSGGGVLNIDGSLNWRSPDAPLVIALRGENVLASDTRDVRAVIDPDVTVRMQTGQPLTVTGTVTVPEALLELERLDDGVSASSDVVVLDPVKPEAEPSSPLAMDLTLAMGDDVQLRGFGLDGKLGGRLRVRAVPGREMTGSGGLEIEGEYKAYGQELQIAQGQLLWSNSPISNPILNVRAEREIGDVIAGIRVTGSASAPQAEAYSNQGGSQSDALAYLTLGRPISGLSSSEASDVSAASAALTAGGGMLASQLGARIGLDDAGVMQSRTAGSVFGVGKYLSPRVYVGYGVSLLGTGQVMMLKYLLRKGFDIQIESSSIENRGSINYRKEK